MKIFRNVISVLSVILSITILAGGVFAVLSKDHDGWGQIIVGAFFLFAVWPGKSWHHDKKRREKSNEVSDRRFS